MSECKKHCWHPTGGGMSHGWGGTDDGVCCQCGTKFGRRWDTRKEPIKGHGPHASRTVKYYVDEVAAPQEGAQP